jgi:D-cysteine desulfhydrase
MRELAFDQFPRVDLGGGPTPMQRAEGLSEELGLEILLKRDDLTGIGLGGNKVRALEFLLGHALRSGCDVLVTGSGPQSNWSFLAALAARRHGLDARLVFYGHRPGREEGNYLLQQVTGADISFTGDSRRASVDAEIEAIADRLRSDGRRPFVLPRGGATPIGSLGYVLAAVEIARQSTHLSLPSPTVWLATGSCGTQAGLVVGASEGLIRHVVGVTVSRSAQECVERVQTLARQAADLLDLASPSRDLIDVRDGFVGDGYGAASAAGREAADLMARTEGVLLDPAFGSKALAALASAARARKVEGPVVFLVSGGQPTLFLDQVDL